MLNYIWEKINEKVVEVFILISISMLLYFDFLIIERIKLFFFILTIIWIFINLWIFFDNFIIEKSNYYENLFKEFNEKKTINDFGKIIIICKKWYRIFYYFCFIKNFILILFSKFQLWFFYFIRYINYNLYNYYYLRFVIVFFLINFINYPVQLIFYFYYKTLYNLKKKSLIVLILKRIEGIIFSIFIFTNLSYYIFYYFNIYQLIIIIYFFLVFISSVQSVLYKFLGNYNLFNIKSLSFVLDAYNISLYQLNFGKFMVLKQEIMSLEKFFVIYIKFLIKIGQLTEKEIIDQNEILYILISNNELNHNSFLLQNYLNNNYYYRIIYDILNNNNDFINWLTEVKFIPPKFFFSIIWLQLVFFSDIGNLILGLHLYRENKEKYLILLKFFNDELQHIKYLIFLLWDIEKFYGFKENYIYIRSCAFFNINYLDNLMTESEIFNEELNIKFEKININLNKEINIDIKEDYKLFIEIYDKAVQKEWKNIEQRKIRNLLKEWNINIKQYLYEDDNIKEVVFVNNEMEKILKEIRKEWEKEWNEGIRNYIWKN